MTTKLKDALAVVLRAIAGLDGELNLSNYDGEDAEYLNSQFVSAQKIAENALSSYAAAKGRV